MNRPLYNILTNGWGERFLSELEETQKENLKITSLRNMLNENYNDYTSFFKLKKYSKEFPIIHMNSWFDIFLLWKKSDNKIIFESHALHPGFDNIHARAIIESRLIRLFVWMFGWFFNIIFERNIKNTDLYLVSTPGFLEKAKEIRSDAEWLPNPVKIPENIERINTLGLEEGLVNIFYPTGLRGIKNPKAAFELLNSLKESYKKIRIYIFRPGNIHGDLFDKIETLKNDIVWLEKADSEKMKEYYRHDWDLVIGSLYPEKPYAILNMIELESMAYQLPIVAVDLYEILLYPINEVPTLAKKLIDDAAFKKEYSKKNREYMKERHSPEKVGKKYISLLNTRISP